MSMNARAIPSNSNRVEQEALQAGVYPARVVQIVSLGTQPQRPYQGQEKDPHLTFRVTYEILDEFIVDEEGNILEDKPRWFSEEFPLHSLESERAKSTKRYYALDPNETHKGDWSKLINTPTMVTITKTPGKGKNEGRTFNNIEGLSTMRGKDAESAVELKNDPVVFDFYDPDVDAFKSMPEWIQDRIKGAVDYEGSALEEALKNYKAPEEEGSAKEENVTPPKDVEENEDW